MARDLQSAAVTTENKTTMTPQNNPASKEKPSKATYARLRPDRNTNRRQDESHQSRWMNRYEHYNDLAQQAGNTDTVARERYWQHAEYFRRLMNGSADPA